MTHTLTRVFLAAFLILLPLQTVASGSLTVADTFAGVATEAQLRGMSGNGRVSLSLTPPSGAALPLQATTDESGNANVPVPGDALQEAGRYRISVDGTAAVASFAVLPGGVDPDNSDIQAIAQNTSQAAITVTVRDRYANPLPGRPVLLIGSRSDDVIHAVTQQTDSQGMQQFLLQATHPGTVSLSAVDVLSSTILTARTQLTLGNATTDVGGDLQASVIPTAKAQDSGIIQSFIVKAPDTVQVGDPFSLEIRAVDAAGNTVTGYTGTAYISAPKDPAVNLPFSDRPATGQLKFLPKELGDKFLSLSVWFGTSGNQDLVVEDGLDPTIRGSATIVVTGETPAQGNKIHITSPKPGTKVGQTLTVAGTGNKFSNFLIAGGAEAVKVTTDANGLFSATVRLPSGAKQATLTVSDESNQQLSDTVTVIVDDSVSSGQASLMPSAAPAESNVLATFQPQDPTDIDRVTLDIANQTLTLTRNPVNQSLFQTNFAAPSQLGTYSAIFHATDTVGNIATVVTELTVTEKGLSTIQSINAQGQPGAVGLSWQPSDVQIDGYKILIGDSQNVGPEGQPTYDRSLSVESTVTSAIVQGLMPGKRYAFMVVGVRGTQEGPQGVPVIAIPSGLAVTVEPGQASLTVSWEFKDAPPLSGYLLQYGVDPTEKPEERVLAAVQSIRIDDLLPRTYYLTLTPIDVTGKKLDQLAVSAEGTPLETLHASGGDPLPEGVDFSQTHTPPKNTGSGLPPVAWWTAIALTIGAFAYVRKQRFRARKTRAFLGMMDTRYKG